MYSFKNALKKGGTARKLLPLLLAGVPWILRDQLASNLEQQSREAQQVLAKLDAQETAEQQGEDLRELNAKLHTMEDNILKAQAKVQETDDLALAGMMQSEGRALERSAKALLKLKDDVDVTTDGSRKLVEAAESAMKTAEKLKGFGASPGQDQNKEETDLEKEWGDASKGLTEAYETLYAQAQKDQAESAVAAKRARYAAWIFTFLAALMMKDWTKAKDMAVDAMGGKGEDAGDDGEEKPAAGEAA